MEYNVVCPGCQRPYTLTTSDLKRKVTVCPHCADSNLHDEKGTRTATYNDVTKLRTFDLMMVVQQRVRILTDLCEEVTTRYNYQTMSEQKLINNKTSSVK